MTATSPNAARTRYNVRFLHISDLHARGKRETQSFARSRVLGKPWTENVAELLEDGPVDFVCFSGDIANWGMPDEYDEASRFIERLLKQLELPVERLFIIPGNHDVERTKAANEWKHIRTSAPQLPPVAFSRWIRGVTSAPIGVQDEQRNALLTRTENFYKWLQKIGLGALVPSSSPHSKLGFRARLAKPEWPFPVHIVGLDSAWLCGDDNDSERLMATVDQVGILGTDEKGEALSGLRLAMIHHPFSYLADADRCEPLFSEYFDLVLRGHVHQERYSTITDPDRALAVLAAGSLFEGDEGDRWPNGHHVVDMTVDANGRPQELHLRFRGWSPKGYWFDDSAIYKRARHGRLKLDLTAPVPKKRETTASATGTRKARAATTRGRVPAAKKVAAPPPPPPAPPAVIDDLFNRDPSVSLPAADALAADPKVSAADIVKRLRGLNPVTVLTARLFLSQRAAESAPLMVQVIRQAHNDWHAATLVPDCFHPAHAPHCADELAKSAASSTPDVARKAIESLGFLAASEWCYELVGRIKKLNDVGDTYFYDKIESYVVEALARMFIYRTMTHGDWYQGHRDELRRVLNTLRDAAGLAAEHGWRSALLGSLLEILAICPVDRADLLLSEWLTAKESDLRFIAVNTLGQMRLQRAIPPLTKVLVDAGEEERVCRSAANAIGAIGGPQAIEALEQAWKMNRPGVQSGVLGGLTLCTTDVPDVDAFANLANRLLASRASEKCWVVRAMGLRADPRFIPEVKKQLSADETSTRAHAALALARLTGPAERKVLETAHRESGSIQEQILTGVALLASGSYAKADTVIAEIRGLLPHESYRYHGLTREDIVTELRQQGGAVAAAMADAWERVYATAPHH